VDLPTASNSPLESKAWHGIFGTWKPLHGSFTELGLSIEWHDFSVDQEMDWGRSFHPGSLELCLNFSGLGSLQDGSRPRALLPNQLAIYTIQDKALRAVRHAASMHRFLTLELSKQFLQTHCSEMIQWLKPSVAAFITGDSSKPFLEISPLPAFLLSAREQFLAPPVPKPARDMWYFGRVLEILSLTLFREDNSEELFCSKYHRTNSERIERVCYLLERDLENPPSLQMLADEVKCSSYYLSRMFTQTTGTSIPKFLRMKRIEKAAKYLKSGKMNVTEAAMAVGYSSLSAFTKAFVEQMGCCPGLYPLVPIEARKRS
jgi:AraC-like DNA-binding protein